jgi:DNA-binding MarR family transcriptional regulator
MKKSRSKTLVQDAHEVIRTCPGIKIRTIERRISHFMEAAIKDAGLSIAQFGLLIHIAAATDDSITALAERLALDQSTLSRNLRGLEEAGLIEIGLSQDDLRRRILWLTEAGARRLEVAVAGWRTARDALSKLIATDALRRLAIQSEALAGR